MSRKIHDIGGKRLTRRRECQCGHLYARPRRDDAAPEKIDAGRPGSESVRPPRNACRSRKTGGAPQRTCGTPQNTRARAARVLRKRGFAEFCARQSRPFAGTVVRRFVFLSQDRFYAGSSALCACRFTNRSNEAAFQGWLMGGTYRGFGVFSGLSGPKFLEEISWAGISSSAYTVSSTQK